MDTEIDSIYGKWFNPPDYGQALFIDIFFAENNPTYFPFS